MKPAFYGFQFPHHGRFSAFSALSREFKRADVEVYRMHIPRIPAWVPGRIQGRIRTAWCQINEHRVKSSFSHGGIVHYFFPENSLFKGAKWRKKGRLVLSCHQPIEFLKRTMRNGHPFYDALKVADRVVLMASCEIDAYRELAPNGQVLCIPHGVDTEFFRPSVSSCARPTSDHCRILTVGNWLRDYEEWAQVVRRMRAVKPSVEFTVIANPDRLKFIQDILGKDMDNVRLLCGLTDECLRDEYLRSDIVYLPLNGAWANNALLEGMSCGCAILVTDLPATREYAGDAALYAEQANIDAITEQMQALWTHPDMRYELGQRARGRAETKFRWDRIAQTYLDLYADLLS